MLVGTLLVKCRSGHGIYWCGKSAYLSFVEFFRKRPHSTSDYLLGCEIFFKKTSYIDICAYFSIPLCCWVQFVPILDDVFPTTEMCFCPFYTYQYIHIWQDKYFKCIHWSMFIYSSLKHITSHQLYRFWGKMHFISLLSKTLVAIQLHSELESYFLQCTFQNPLTMHQVREKFP